MANDIVLETSALTKSFKGYLAVDRVNLRVRRNTIHALIGPNGAGKTTVFNLLTHFLPPTSGKIYHEGQDITHHSPMRIARDGMVRSFQISAVFPHMTVRENIRLGLQSKLGLSFHFWRPLSYLALLEERVHELADTVGLADVLNQPAGDLPYGRKRTLEIATTLALEPRMLLLDEPTSGLGTEDVGRVTELIRSASRNRTVLMVEHNMAVVANLSHTITVMQQGGVLAEGEYAAISKDPRVMEAYVGTSHA